MTFEQFGSGKDCSSTISICILYGYKIAQLCYIYVCGNLVKSDVVYRYYKDYFETVEDGRGDITFVIRLNATGNSEFNVIVIYKIYIIVVSIIK